MSNHETTAGSLLSTILPEETSAMKAGFSAMDLPQPIQKALEVLKFTTPTPIQEQAIPIILNGRDLIGCAQTGTGKTAAFSLPLLARLEANPDETAVILVPTRELAFQIEEVLRKLSRYLTKMNLALLIGGADMRKQYRSLQSGARIVVATPGRLMDHLKRENLTLESTAVLVLDEADRMLDMGFSRQLDDILRYLPRQRQTLLFSATLPSDIQKLALKYLHDPEKVTVGSTSKPIDQITQTAIQVTRANKNDTLMNELNSRQGTVIIFAKTQHGTDRLANVLEEYGFSVARMHGGRTQGQRNAALQGFRTGKFRILVATDVAARGLDIPHIAHVINFDLPQTPEDYIHRIGRTARAGQTGESLSLITPDDNGEWRRICRHCKQDVAIQGAVASHDDSSRGSSRGGGRSQSRGHGGRGKSNWGSRRDEGSSWGARGRSENRSESRFDRSGDRKTERSFDRPKRDKFGSDFKPDRKFEGRSESFSDRPSWGSSDRRDLGFERKPRAQQNGSDFRRTERPRFDGQSQARRPRFEDESRRPDSEPKSWAEKTQESRKSSGPAKSFNRRRSNPFGFREERPSPDSRAREVRGSNRRDEAPVWSDERPQFDRKRRYPKTSPSKSW